MSEIALELDSISIEDEMKQSYLDYAMSVIVGRAFTGCPGRPETCSPSCFICNA